jgi:hypothetical protein
MSPEKYSQEAFYTARRIIREFNLGWIEVIRKDLTNILKIYQNYLQVQHKKQNEISSGQILNSEFESFLRRILEWIESIADLPNKISLDNLSVKWQEEFQETLSGMPEKITIDYDDKFLHELDSDSTLIRIWKRENRLIKQIQGFINKFSNRIKRLLKLPETILGIRKRQFSPSHLSEKYLSLPALKIIVDEWQYCLQDTARLMVELHHKTENLKDHLLFKDNNPVMCRQMDSEARGEFLELLKDVVEIIQIFQKQLNHWSERASTRIEEKWDSLGDRYLKTWDYAGTFVLSNRQLTSKKVDSEWKLFHKKFSDIKDSWSQLFSAEYREWRKDLELSILQLQTSIICNKAVNTVESKIADYFIPPFEGTKEIIKLSLEKFTVLEVNNTEEFKTIILDENRELLRTLRRDSLPKMMDNILKANLEADVQKYHTELSLALDSLSDRHVIFTDRDLENIPPKSKTSEIPLEDLIKEIFFNELNNKFQQLSGEVHSRLEKIVRDISEIDQIVEFNLEAGLHLLDENKEGALNETHSIIIEGLERTFNQIKELVENSLQIFVLVQEKLVELTLKFETQIQELADSEKILELKLRVAKSKAEEEFRNTLRKTWKTTRTLIPIASRYIYKKFNDLLVYYKKLRKITRLAPQIHNIEEELTRFLTETNLRIKALPYVYQRLFRLSPLEDERFFTGRDDELSKIGDQFDKWKKDLHAATALVGERGSGKTTLLNFVEEHYFKQYPMVKYDFSRMEYSETALLEVLKEIFNIKEVKDYNDLKINIESLKVKRVVIFENIQNIFLRVIDGFQGLEKLLLFMSQTNHQIFWMITCTLYSWHYLDKVLQISKYFHNVIQLGDLSEIQVREIILKRHRVSGFEIEYTEPEDIKSNRKYRKINNQEKKQEYIQNLFFRDLNELSNGNVSVAMLFWQRAIQEIRTDKLIVYPFLNIDFSFLYQLSYEELFTLAAFMQHEILNVAQHAHIFHQNQTKSALMLNRLLNNGIIVQHPNGYHIHPFLYRAIVRTLKSKNIIY